MKLKIKAEAQDVVVFIVFTIFLFIIVGLGIVNLIHLSKTGTFYGLNFLPAFLPPLLSTTIGLSFLILIGIFLSVKSVFFEMEKGFGFEIGSKEEKGYSRWMTNKEMKSLLKEIDPASSSEDEVGIPLVSENGKLWVDTAIHHNLVIGSTGSGKTVNVILPSVKVLAKAKQSMIITDPKGEIYEKTSNMLREKGYKIVLLNFRNPAAGNAWNPMTIPYELYQKGEIDKSVELIEDLAFNILKDEASTQDAFWQNAASDYFAGLTLGLFEDAQPEEINLNSISLFSTVGEERIGSSNYVKEYFLSKDPNSSAYVNASGTFLAPDETKASIVSIFKEKIKTFASRENLSEMLSYSDFSMREIGERPTAVFIIVHDEKTTYHSLATIFLKQCYETLIDVAFQNGGSLPITTNFLLDEFANMPPLKSVDSMITAARSRKIRFTFIIQNFSQLNNVYGDHVAETIRGNCQNTIYLLSTELKALEEISRLCGEVKSKKDDKTASTPLATVTDLQRMKEFDQIVLHTRQHPFKTSFTPDFKIPWGKEYPLAGYPAREVKPIQIFDVKTFVQNSRKDRQKAMLEKIGKNPNQPPVMGMNERPMVPPTKGMSAGAPSATDTKNLESLIQKIDRNIAAIEKEESQKQSIEEKINARLREKELRSNQVVNKEALEKDFIQNKNQEKRIDDTDLLEAKINARLNKRDTDNYFDDFFEE